MPASLPGETLANNLANPAAGQPVNFDLLSGPKNSPLDVRIITGYVAGSPTYANDAANQKPSTGALSTGIGFGGEVLIGPVAPDSIKKAGFTDDYTPGVTKPDGTASANSTLMYIGGGRTVASAAQKGIPFAPNPYTAGFGIGNGGNGGSRDAGAGPAFTGFASKTVTAAAGIANGAAVETGFVNRTGAAILTGQSVFGSATAASAAVA